MPAVFGLWSYITLKEIIVKWTRRLWLLAHNVADSLGKRHIFACFGIVVQVNGEQKNDANNKKEG